MEKDIKYFVHCAIWCPPSHCDVALWHLLPSIKFDVKQHDCFWQKPTTVMNMWNVMERMRRCTKERGPRFLIKCSEAIIWWVFLLYCIRLEISSKSDIRILDQTFIFVIYQNTIRRVHLQMGQFYKHVWGASSENRVNLRTLIVKRHQTFVI